MDEDSDIISDPEPIPDEEPTDHEPTPEQDSPDDGDDEGFWEVERAREVLEQAVSEAPEDPGLPYEREVLEAAASLKQQHRPQFERLKADIGAFVDMRKWPSMVDDVASDLEVEQFRSSHDKPVIQDRAAMHEMEQEAVEALQEVNGLYERDREIFEIYEGGEEAELTEVEGDHLRSVLSDAAQFERMTQEGPKPIKPPKSVTRAVEGRNSWGLPKIRGLVDGAAFLEDGTILTTEGYHPDAGLYLRNGSDVSCPKSPSQEDAEAAREELMGLLVDFEFVDERRSAHASAWLAAALTIPARPAIGAYHPTPMFLFDANIPGVGKTKLAEIACEIPMGRLPSPRPLPTGRNSDNEMRKTITAVSRAGVPVVFFDNIRGNIGGGSLELALTGKKWSSRVLQKSKDWSGPLMVTWMATSNQTSLTQDMARRVLLCRIETDHPNPQQRSGFKHPRLQQHIREHRDRYLEHLLTILRAWYVAGEPEHGLTSWGSFEEWSRIVRNAIVFAGGTDPYHTCEDLEGANRKSSLAQWILEVWPKGLKLSSSEIGEAIDEGEIPKMGFKGNEQADELVAALDELLGTTNASSIGSQIRHNVADKVDGEVGRKLVKGQGSGSSGRYWTVVEVDSAGDDS